MPSNLVLKAKMEGSANNPQVGLFTTKEEKMSHSLYGGRSLFALHLVSGAWRGVVSDGFVTVTVTITLNHGLIHIMRA
jgi:hypothetical protein